MYYEVLSAIDGSNFMKKSSTSMCEVRFSQLVKLNIFPAVTVLWCRPAGSDSGTTMSLSEKEQHLKDLVKEIHFQSFDGDTSGNDKRMGEDHDNRSRTMSWMPTHKKIPVLGQHGPYICSAIATVSDVTVYQ
jgi:hypothetical protein